MGTVTGYTSTGSDSEYVAKGVSQALTSMELFQARANLMISPAPHAYRVVPQRTFVTQFQTGHGWSVQSGTWTTDTSDFEYGTQSVSTTTTSTGAAYKHYAMAARDLSAASFAVLVKVDDPTQLDYIALYLGTSSFANFVPLIATHGGSSGNTALQPGQWTWIYFTWADAGNTTGTLDRTLITDMQFKVLALSVDTVTVHVNAIAYFPTPTSPWPHGVVSFAFDDSYNMQYSLAAPALDVYGWGASAMTIQDYLGQSGAMTLTQLHDLCARHGWEACGHAYLKANHDIGYPFLDPAVAELDARNLADWLRGEGFAGKDIFAYPGGSDTTAINDMIRRYFTLGRQIVRYPSQALPLDAPMRIRSWSVSSSDSLATIEATIDKAYTSGVWLILTFHQLVTVAPTAGTQWPLTNFTSLLAYINAKPMPVRTIGAVLDSIRSGP